MGKVYRGSLFLGLGVGAVTQHKCPLALPGPTVGTAEPELPLVPHSGSRLLRLFRKIMSRALQCCRGRGKEEGVASNSGSISLYSHWMREEQMGGVSGDLLAVCACF